jgi:thiamine transport system ATP-binding protein
MLLYEPFGALDRSLRERLVAEVAGILRWAGVATIVVTHDQDEAAVMADRVAVLADRRLVQTGTPVEVWQRPVSPEVSALLGFGPAVEAHRGAGVLETPWGVVPDTDAGVRRSVLLVLRPDALAIVDDESGLEPTWPGRVVRSVPRGAAMWTEVVVNDTAAVGITDIRARVAGAPVRVQLRVDRCLFY